jgi:tripartite-type tricarboxylate transporter receptor subunit TctC
LAVIRSPEFAKRLALGGSEPMGSSVEEFAARISSETARFAKIVKDGNVQVE